MTPDRAANGGVMDIQKVRNLFLFVAVDGVAGDDGLIPLSQRAPFPENFLQRRSVCVTLRFGDFLSGPFLGNRILDLVDKCLLPEKKLGLQLRPGRVPADPR